MTTGSGSAVDDEWGDVPVDGPETLAEQRLLASFGQRARAANLLRVVRLSELLDSADAGALDEEGRREGENLAHQVVGSAGTFGQPGASREAVSVERYFAETGAAGCRSRTGDAARVRRVVDRLRLEFGG